MHAKNEIPEKKDILAQIDSMGIDFNEKEIDTGMSIIAIGLNMTLSSHFRIGKPYHRLFINASLEITSTKSMTKRITMTIYGSRPCDSAIQLNNRVKEYITETVN